MLKKIFSESVFSVIPTRIYTDESWSQPWIRQHYNGTCYRRIPKCNTVLQHKWTFCNPKFDQICPKIATFRPFLTPKSPKTVGHSPLTKTELTLNTSDTSNISHCTPCHLLWNSSKSASFKSLYIFSCTAKSSDAVSLTLWMNSSRPPAE